MTTLELFFDLVFAFTLTQLAALLVHHFSPGGALEVLLVFGVLWWMYGGYAWLTNTRAPVRTPDRLLLLVGHGRLPDLRPGDPARFRPRRHRRPGSPSASGT